MKKLIAIILIGLTTSMAITSCTEEEVTPSTEMNGGGSGSDPKP